MRLAEMENVVNLCAQFPAWQVGQMIGKSSTMVRYIVRRYKELTQDKNEVKQDCTQGDGQPGE